MINESSCQCDYCYTVFSSEVMTFKNPRRKGMVVFNVHLNTDGEHICEQCLKELRVQANIVQDAVEEHEEIFHRCKSLRELKGGDCR